MRWLIAIAFTLMAILAALLFQVQQWSWSLRAEVARLERSLRERQATAKILEAEWTYLTRPERLQKLARSLGLDYQTSRPGQFGTWQPEDGSDPLPPLKQQKSAPPISPPVSGQ